MELLLSLVVLVTIEIPSKPAAVCHATQALSLPQCSCVRTAALMASTQSKNERLKTYQPAVLQDICASAASTQRQQKPATADLDSPGT